MIEDKEKSSEKSGLSSPTFDPRNPHVLSSVLICPPPCYEDLYGNAGAVFTFKSLTPERDEPPSISSQVKQTDGKSGEEVLATNPNSRAQYQYYSNNGNHTCLLQVPPQDTTAVPNQERRNSSAVLYL